MRLALILMAAAVVAVTGGAAYVVVQMRGGMAAARSRADQAERDGRDRAAEAAAARKELAAARAAEADRVRGEAAAAKAAEARAAAAKAQSLVKPVYPATFDECVKQAIAILEKEAEGEWQERAAYFRGDGAIPNEAGLIEYRKYGPEMFERHSRGRLQLAGMTRIARRESGILGLTWPLLEGFLKFGWDRVPELKDPRKMAAAGSRACQSVLAQNVIELMGIAGGGYDPQRHEGSKAQADFILGVEVPLAK